MVQAFAVRILEIYLHEGEKVLLRTAVWLLQRIQARLLRMDFTEILMFLQRELDLDAAFSEPNSAIKAIMQVRLSIPLCVALATCLQE
jgi:hypothetical protein